jgi:hypothetical protein
MVGEGEEQEARLRRNRAENAAVEMVGSIGSRFQDYVSDWIASFDAAINGEYDAQRLVTDVSRMTSRMVRDTADLFVSGFDVLNVLANMPARDRSQRPEKAEPQS